MADLFIEILSEEIPARMQKAALNQLKTQVEGFFKSNGLEYAHVNTYISPRRMVVEACQVATKKPEETTQRRGPRADAPQKAIDGFMKGLNGAEWEIVETPKGKFYFANVIIPAVATKDLLPKLVQEILLKFTWPKSMRWAETKHSWVRPIQSGICIFDDEVVDFAISMKDGSIINDYDGDEYEVVRFSNVTKGHRNNGNKDISVQNFANYIQKLTQNQVIVDHSGRKANIKKQIAEITQQNGLEVVPDEGLFEEVIGLAEYPHVLLGDIAPEFMSLPSSVLITCMASHNKYFALRCANGDMAPNFLVVADYLPRGYDKSLPGFERVLKARFYDASFFYHEDCQQKLADFAPKLTKINFHNKLGTVADKVESIKVIIETLVSDLKLLDIDVERAKKAADLCKCDLATQMVYEFPSLQGIMGADYAKVSGESEEISQAIGQHYLPQGPNDDLPQSDLGKILSLADKIDTLVGFFGIDIKPTGSKDPFGLRRASIGIIRIMETVPVVNLGQMIKAVADSISKRVIGEDALSQLMVFFKERLKAYWLEQDISHAAINCLIDYMDNVSLYDLKERAHALDKFIVIDKQKGEDSLLQMYKRLNNILKSAPNNLPEVNSALLQESAERLLYDNGQQLDAKADELLKNAKYSQFLDELCSVIPCLSDFFANVMVNVEDEKVRLNRFSLLHKLNKLLQKFADFAKI